MPNRQYTCGKCGKLKRVAKVYASERENYQSCPRCCNVPMILLTFVQAEAATKISDEQRCKWVASGCHVLDRGGKRGWIPVTADWQIEEAKRQLASFDRNAKKGYCPPMPGND